MHGFLTLKNFHLSQTQNDPSSSVSMKPDPTADHISGFWEILPPLHNMCVLIVLTYNIAGVRVSAPWSKMNLIKQFSFYR